MDEDSGVAGLPVYRSEINEDFKLCACGCDASVGTTSWCVFESRHIGGRLETVLRWAKGEGLTQQPGGVMLKSFLYLVAFVAIAAPLVRAQTTSIIEGTVTDQQGLPIVGADVRIVGALRYKRGGMSGATPGSVLARDFTYQISIDYVPNFRCHSTLSLTQCRMPSASGQRESATNRLGEHGGMGLGPMRQECKVLHDEAA